MPAQYAASFNGSSNYLSRANFTGNPTAFTVAHWVNLATTQLSRIFFGDWLPGGGNQGFATGISDSTNNKVKFYLGSNTLYQSGTLTPGTWAFVACTYDGTTAKIYLNGATTPDATLTSSIVYSTVPTNNYIGQLGNSSQFLNGKLAALGYWNRALTAAETASLYNSGVGMAYADLSGSLPTNLVSYYDFANISNVGLDSASAGNNLTNTGTVFRAYGPVPWSFAAGTGGRTSNNGLDATFNFGTTNPAASGPNPMFSCWINAASWDQASQSFFSQLGASNGWTLQRASSTPGVQFTTPGTGGATSTSTSVLTAGWVHVAGFVSPSGFSPLYVNGVNVASSGNGGANPFASGNPLAIGIPSSNIAVAEPSLFRNLTQGQADTIAANLAAGRSPMAQTPSPSFYSRFGSGSTETDLVNSLTATLPSNSYAVQGPAVDAPPVATKFRRIGMDGGIPSFLYTGGF